MKPLSPQGPKSLLFLFVFFSMGLNFQSLAQAAWVPNGSSIYFSGGNVSIGTAAAPAPLLVYGGNTMLWGLNLGYGTNLGVITTDAPTKELSFQLGGTEYARMAAGGAMLIGRNNLINAGDKLEVTGIANILGLTLGFGSGLAVISSDGASKEMSLQLGGTEYVRLNTSGNFLIGKSSQTNTSYKLDVNGIARANQVVVNTTGADFVFDPTYKLPSLRATEKYIRQNHHLEGIAPAADMQQNGIDLGENQIRLLRKIEELTLYSIDQNKKLAAQQAEIDELKKIVKDLATKK